MHVCVWVGSMLFTEHMLTLSQHVCKGHVAVGG